MMILVTIFLQMIYKQLKLYIMLTLCILPRFKGSKIEFMKIAFSCVFIDSSYITALLIL